MKRKQINVNSNHLKMRRNNIIKYFISITIITLLIAFCLFKVLKNEKKYVVKYNENSNINYKVFLKENSFFKDKYLTKNKQYIASLIDKVEADFNYSLTTDNRPINCNYSYRIQANIDVREKKSNNSLYNYTDMIVEETSSQIYNSSNININKTVSVDYNKYNELISRFIKLYELDDAEATLSLDMYVTIDSEYDEAKTSVTSLNIPLSTKTVEIDMKSDLINSNDNYLVYKESKVNNNSYYIYLVILILIDFVLIVNYKLYEKSSMNEEIIYNKKLKKILSNYHSYIQKTSSDFNFYGYKVIKLLSFNELLEIREIVDSPILMFEKKSKVKTVFMIISDRVIYLYELKKYQEEKEDIDVI